MTRKEIKDYLDKIKVVQFTPPLFKGNIEGCVLIDYYSYNDSTNTHLIVKHKNKFYYILYEEFYFSHQDQEAGGEHNTAFYVKEIADLHLELEKMYIKIYKDNNIYDYHLEIKRREK